MIAPLCQLSKHVSVASPVMCFVGEENDIIDFYFRQKIIGKSCIYKKVCVFRNKNGQIT